MKKHKHKFEDKFEYLSIAETMINQAYEKGDKHFFVYADVDVDKIYGGFSDEEFENAVMTFIQNNYNNVITPMLNARDEYGKKIHTAQSAISEYKKRLMNYKR
jgi:citrate lyase synthetase